jgi:hypothetical protein
VSEGEVEFLLGDAEGKAELGLGPQGFRFGLPVGLVEVVAPACGEERAEEAGRE